MPTRVVRVGDMNNTEKATRGNIKVGDQIICLSWIPLGGVSQRAQIPMTVGRIEKDGALTMFYTEDGVYINEIVGRGTVNKVVCSEVNL